MHRTLYLMAGPTAVGKSALALAWAEANHAEILSCDALQVYQGMDIGTAKPTPPERARVPHHGLDLVPPSERFSVDAYANYAQAAVRDILARGRRVLVVGGSGFYLKSFFAPVTDELEIPEPVRAEVDALFQDFGLAYAVRRLREVSPEGLGRVDLCNPRRVAKALERCLASGLSVPELEARHAAAPCAFDSFERRLVLLERAEADLRTRIARRTQAMLKAGLIEEVRTLCEQGLRDNPAAATAIGYREVIDWLRGKLAEGAATEDLAAVIDANTWRLVRKQRTWFRKQLSVEAVLPLQPDEDSAQALPRLRELGWPS
ncbi:MAG: tRNA (adenosine(37)-N6)-dimethylallyltransferase MiaA [Opitutales bacterium]